MWSNGEMKEIPRLSRILNSFNNKRYCSFRSPLPTTASNVSLIDYLDFRFFLWFSKKFFLLLHHQRSKKSIVWITFALRFELSHTFPHSMHYTKHPEWWRWCLDAFKQIFFFLLYNMSSSVHVETRRNLRRTSYHMFCNVCLNGIIKNIVIGTLFNERVRGKRLTTLSSYYSRKSHLSGFVIECRLLPIVERERKRRKKMILWSPESMETARKAKNDRKKILFTSSSRRENEILVNGAISSDDDSGNKSLLI